MKLHPDGVVEGTPEECAAYRHIDAALGQRTKPKPAAGPKLVKESAAKKPKPGTLIQKIVTLAAAKDGITSSDVAEHFGMDRKVAYSRLYQMLQREWLWQPERGVFKAYKA